MFNEDNLFKFHSADGFTIWRYKAANRQDADAARNQLGYFPHGPKAITPGDVIYITDDDMTTHHWTQLNKTEDKLSVWLFGG
jgi:hypothetical protein